jgi:uncharacterized peroxidase-related enzyme
MQVIQPIHTEDAAGSTRRLLEAVKNERGAVSNMIKTMAHSPLALEGYLKFSRALAAASLTPEVREQIALTVAQANACDYSLAEHAALAGRLGLTNDEILESREARAPGKKTAAVLRFARDLVVRGGDSSTVELREAGFGDAEIVEIVALVALNVFENYFNAMAQTELDYPKAGRKAKAA